MIESLRMRGFRRFPEASVEFGPGLNLVQGENNAGKTSLLLAIEYALFGRVAGYTSLFGLLHPKARGLGVELRFRAKNGQSYVLQRAHLKPPRAKSKLVGHFTLLRAGVGEEPSAYLASSDFSNTEDDLAKHVFDLIGITRRVFEQVIHVKQGHVTDILEGSAKLDAVLGVTTAAVASDELRGFALEQEKRAGNAELLRTRLNAIAHEEQTLANAAAEHSTQAEDRERAKASHTERVTTAEAELARLQPLHAALGALRVAGSNHARATETLQAARARSQSAASGDDQTRQDLLTRREGALANQTRERGRIDDLAEARAVLERKHGDLSGQLERQASLVGGTRCETCGQLVDAAHLERERSKLEAAVKSLDGELEAAQAERRTAKGALDDATRTLAQLDAAIAANESLRQQKEALFAELGRAELALIAASAKLDEAVISAEAALERPKSASASAGSAEELISALQREVERREANARDQRADARARLAALADADAQARARVSETTAALQRIARERADLGNQLKQAESAERVARQLRALSGAFKTLQRSLRERACESLAADTMRLHSALSGDGSELLEMRVDPERYLVQVTPSDIGAEVPAHLFQGGGHRLLLGLALRLALAKHVGGCPFLLLDEPTYGLDAARRDALLDRLETALGGTTQLLLITHHDVSTRSAFRIRVERKGKQSNLLTQGASV
ncbi:MAG: AAA family ATPase [Polyangiaceae bacterium]